MQYGNTVLFVDDVPAVLAFYRSAFGFQTKFYDQEFGFALLDTAGGDIAIASHDAGSRMMPGTYRRPDSGHPEGVEIAFYTSDVAAAYDRATSAGALSLAAPRKMPWGQTVAYVRSIEGSIIGFCTQPDSLA